MKGELLRLIDRVDVVSFDIFDTAVLRAVRYPTDVFDLVQELLKARYGIELHGFKHARIQAEGQAREKAWTMHQCAETTLDEIYECLREAAVTDREVLEKLKELEIEVETKVCLANSLIQDIYRSCLERGKKVIFTSDMYLPADIVVAILKNCGYAASEKIFLSSSLGVTKSTGELYAHICKELSCKPDDVLHIGDNPDSDVKAAHERGIRTYYYEKCISRAEACEELVRGLFAEFSGGGGSIQESLYLGVVTNRHCMHLSPQEYDHQPDFWYEFGYRYAGILFYGFGCWLRDQVRRDDIEKVYFLSRDGYIMKKVYDILVAHEAVCPPSEYMYASRRALNVPGITEIDNLTLDFLVSGTSILTVGQFLQRLGFVPAEYEIKIRDAGFESSEHRVTSGHDYAMLRKLYYSMADDLKRVAEEERVALGEYLRQIGFFGCRRLALVDIGWHGTMQRSIGKLLRLFGNEAFIKGYYLGTWSKASELAAEGYEMSSYLCESGRPTEMHDILKLCVEIFEFLHTAPHGSVIKFERKAGTVVPVFDQNDVDSQRVEKADALQRGALDFVRDFNAIHTHFEFVRVPRELALKPLHRVLRRPTLKEAGNLGDLEHAEGFGDVYVKRHIARPPSLTEAILNPLSIVSKYRQSFWKAGYTTRMVPFRSLLKG